MTFLLLVCSLYGTTTPTTINTAAAAVGFLSCWFINSMNRAIIVPRLTALAAVVEVFRVCLST